MALSDRTGADAPYAQQLLYDRDAHDASREVVGATRGVYARGRGEDHAPPAAGGCIFNAQGMRSARP
jgi:hypothetical protein